jgi:acetyl esterase/lipase
MIKSFIIKSFVICLLPAITTGTAGAAEPQWPRVVADLVNGAPAADAGPAADSSGSCDQVTFSRNLKYGESDLNVLDVATGDIKGTAPRPVLLFVAGDRFAGSAPDPATTTGQDNTQDKSQGKSQGEALQDKAMCFAARNGMVGVSITYRLAPAAGWPAGARDVAAAASWIHQNIDLFKGNAQEIVAIGYAAGAFHVASFLAHTEFQESDSNVAGAVLVSGIYHSGPDASADEKSYLGSDPSKYDERSALPGILKAGVPLVLAWSAQDTPHLVAQGEKLKSLLCGADHCPRTKILDKRENSLASAFGLDDGTEPSLADPTLQMVRQIEARGLP